MLELAGGVEIGLSDKSDGIMKVLDERRADEVRGNRERFLSEMGLGMDEVGFVHVNYVGVEDFCEFARMSERSRLSLDREAVRCDGLMTEERSVGLFLPLADCLGVVMFDEESGKLMMVHAGRHTLEQDGVFAAVEFMGVEASGVRAWLSPAAGKESYQVWKLGNVGLQEAATMQLVRAGVLLQNIEASEIDTTADEDYWSHSRGDEGERFAIVAVRR